MDIEKKISRIDNNKIKSQKDKWRKNILSGTPRYINLTYDNKTKTVKVEYLGELENVKKYYSETSVIKIREEVKDKIEEIRKRKLLSDESFTITISEEQYKNFVNYELKDLQSKIEAKINGNEQTNETQK